MIQLLSAYFLGVTLQTRGEDGTQLSGYGVQLAVKNSEYKAVDDTQVKGQEVITPDSDPCMLYD